MQRRETGREKALMEVGGKLSVEEEYEQRSGLESGLVKKEYESEGKKITDDDCGGPKVYRNWPLK